MEHNKILVKVATLFIGGVLMLGSCVNEERSGTGCTVNMYLSMGSSSYRSNYPATRAMPSGYHAFTTADLTGQNPAIHLFFKPGSPETSPAQITFSYSAATTSWKSNNAILAEQNFYTYGYMPAVIDAHSGSGNASVGTAPLAGSYADGAELTFTGLSSVSMQDVCVVSGVEASTQQNDFENTAIAVGSYEIETSEDNNYLYVLMDHLYAKVALKFNVPAAPDAYQQIRTIKLKKVVMTTSAHEVTVTATAPNDGTKPVVTHADATGAEEADKTITLFDVSGDPDNNDGVELTPDGVVATMPVFISPMGAGEEKEFTFVSTYNVYIKGQITPIRINCTAQNKWTLHAPAGGLPAGHSMELTATVDPTYLYVLGDPDMKNPFVFKGSD